MLDEIKNQIPIQIYYSAVEINKEYSFRFLKIKPKKNTVSNCDYYIFESVSLEDYPELPTKKEQIVLLHFPIQTYKIAMNEILQYQNIKEDYNVTEFTRADIKFIRKSIKKLVFTSLKLYEI